MTTWPDRRILDFVGIEVPIIEAPWPAHAEC